MMRVCYAGVLIASVCTAFIWPDGKGHLGAVSPLKAGFGAASAKKKKTFVTGGKKDLEKQWENFVAFQRIGSNLLSCQAVWARIGEDGPWLRIGSVVTKGKATNAEAVAVQKPLISWTAGELQPPLNVKGAKLEYGLGPYIDDDDKEKGGKEDTSKVVPVGPVKAGDNKAKDVGFKPLRSPLLEHQTSLAGALLNPSKGKGSAKFKGVAAANANADGAADSKGVL